MVHYFPALSPLCLEAREAMEDICAFLRRHLPVDKPSTTDA